MKTRRHAHVMLNAADNVVVAVDTIDKGVAAAGMVAAARMPTGHKMAVAPSPQGEPMRKFGQIIGFAKVAHRARRLGA